MSANFTCHLAAPAAPLPHVWEHTVGSCHAPLALRADWQGQLRRCRALLYTEWNTSSNPRYPRQDEASAAAFAVKAALEVSGLVEAYAFWTFTDIFEENYFPSVPFHGGFGLLNLHGVPKPAYRAFERLRRLGEEHWPAEGSHDTVDTWAVRRPGGLTVLLANHALPRLPIARGTVGWNWRMRRRGRSASGGPRDTGRCANRLTRTSSRVGAYLTRAALIDSSLLSFPAV